MFVLRPIEGKKDITHLISLSLKQSSLRRRGKPRRRRRITATNYVAEVQLPKGSTPLTEDNKKKGVSANYCCGGPLPVEYISADLL
jgi:hypothetical protein